MYELTTLDFQQYLPFTYVRGLMSRGLGAY